MNSTDTFKFFNDSKFIGIEKINNSCHENLTITNKFVRICKDFYFAQDLYVKALLKINASLSQFSDNNCDCINPILSFFSITFCVFTNVQNEFTTSLNKVIRSLNSSCENKDGIFGKVFNSKQLSVITDFKNAEIQLNKSKQKYFSLCGLCNGAIGTDNDKSEKSLKRSKELYQAAITNYNKIRISYLEILNEGFNRSKENHFTHLNSMRRCIKSFGNALAKLVFDLKETIDSIKHYYRSFNKEEIFYSWAESNKTVLNPYVESFPEAVMEFPDNSYNDDLLIDCISFPVSNNDTSCAEKGKNRKLSHNVISSGCNIIDQDIPDSVSQDSAGNNKPNVEKPSVAAIKGGKKRFSLFTSIMKFKSTTNLVDENKFVEDNNVENWQSRNNLQDNVLVDDEGFIIRGNPDNDTRRLSTSSFSSESSNGNRIRGLKKLNIKPINELSKKSETNSELMTVAMQLPLPNREKTKLDVSKRISNLQRSTRPVSYLTKDKLYRRSLSVSEIQHIRNELDSPTYPYVTTKNSTLGQETISIPVACALIEVITSDSMRNTCTIQGQITVAFPLSFKQFLLDTPNSQLPAVISFTFVDNSHQITLAQITNQLEAVTKLEKIDNYIYHISIIPEYLKNKLAHGAMSTNKFEIANRISLPILEYVASVTNYLNKVIECQARWAVVQIPNIQFDFILSSPHFKENKPVIVKIKLLTGGFIEDIFSKNDLIIEKLNDQCWKINYDKPENRISVIIKNENAKMVKLKMSYEFVFEKFSLLKPELSMANNRACSNIDFKISLVHYRTISTGNFNQIFEYNIS